MRLRALLLIFVLALVGLGLASITEPLTADAATPAEIQQQIEERNQQISDLEAEIAEFQKQLNVLGGQRQTLQSTIRQLDISRSQLSTQIRLTESKIANANLHLEELGFSIEDKERVIELDRDAIAESIRAIDTADDVSLIEQLFSADSLADAWRKADSLAALNQALRDNVKILANAKIDLEEQQRQVAATKQELVALQTDLVTQKRGLDVNRQAQAQLLAQTQNQESQYQALIAQKQAQRKAFEQELSALEDSLKIAIDPNRIPNAGSGVLSWPFPTDFMANCATRQGVLGNAFCITQYFGNTSFSTANPQVYNGGGHNAVDFGAPIGSPVTAALSGTVLDTGNTDAIPGCYSFGRWVVIRHNNGLSTLYAHLSNVQVSAGQSVSTGQLIGYSGMTGYATGPHLHFGVYASQGLQITTLAAYRGATSPCANAKMPVAPKDAYLNPMSYL